MIASCVLKSGNEKSYKNRSTDHDMVWSVRPFLKQHFAKTMSSRSTSPANSVPCQSKNHSPGRYGIFFGPFSGNTDF